MDQLHVYNTLSRKKELFEPLIPDFVRMYVCGPTVYGDAHLGHAKSYVAFDVIVRFLRSQGLKVRYVQNITDVGHLTDDGDAGDDKLAKQAAKERLEPMEVAEKYTNSYWRDMDALGNIRPDITPKASGHIPEQIAMIKILIEKGNAYETNGNVYFDVSTDSEYGKLSGRTLEEAQSGNRVEIAGDKHNAADFALWKKADESHIMKWDSPWSVGYPGWHIECSAMSAKYLGESFDIHGGGLENQFPHHECEIAQSEKCFDAPFVKYWLHNNMVTLNGQKMGKSLGNAISLHQFFSGDHPLLTRSWSPQVIRFFLLQSHYRSTTDFSEEALTAAESGLKNLLRLLKTIDSAKNGKGESVDIEALKTHFLAPMNDDFNTARVLAAGFDQLKGIAQKAEKGKIENVEEIQKVVKSIFKDVLGIWPNSAEGSTLKPALDAAMELIFEMRSQARAEKNWAVADAIRNKLGEAGITIKDGAEGSTYEVEA